MANTDTPIIDAAASDWRTSTGEMRSVSVTVARNVERCAWKLARFAERVGTVGADSVQNCRDAETAIKELKALIGQT